MSDKPKIFVFCNSCQPGWHSMEALSEDGCFLAAHVCSSHGFARHDMGIDEDGWKRKRYAAHYPDGFEVVWAEHDEVRAGNHAGINAAYAKHKRWDSDEYHKRLEPAARERKS